MLVQIWVIEYYCLAGCTIAGDGFCDDSTNDGRCDFDGGDCCLPNINDQYCTFCICYADNPEGEPVCFHLLVEYDFIVQNLRMLELWSNWRLQMRWGCKYCHLWLWRRWLLQSCYRFQEMLWWCLYLSWRWSKSSRICL